MKLQRIEPPHHHSNHGAQRDHHGPENSPKPSQRPVDTHLPHAHQRRLQNKENHPPGKCRGVNPQKHRLRRSGMKQIPVDRLAETGHHNSSHNQRKEEVEVAIHQAASAENP
jgi:hypothetical protein